MDHVPSSQLYNDHNQRQPQPAPLYNAPVPRPTHNSHKPPTHPTPNTYQLQRHQPNHWREISSVSTRRLYPSSPSSLYPARPPPPPAPRPDTSSFVIVMYTTLTVKPDSSPPPQGEPARALNSMGYPTSRPDLPVTHVSAVGGAGTITVSAAAPPTTSAPARPSYATDNFYSDPPRQERNFNNNYTDRPQNHYQPDTLPRPHDYPVPPYPVHTPDSNIQYPHSLPPQPAPLDTRHPPYHQHQEYGQQQMHHMHSLPDTTALSRQPRVNGPILFRGDGSIPATPTTPATSATQPFSATPSSPDNNGASSNGSGTREHACTFPGCTKTFDRRYNLTVHYRRHTNEMPYPCKFPGCPQKFKWRSSQSHHMKTRHQIAGVGRLARNNVMRQTGNTTGMNGHSAGGSTAAPMPESSMLPSHAPIIGLVAHEESTGTYKRPFSPRKRQRTESHTS